MNKLNGKLIATSITSLVFIIISVTGVMLYFHFYGQYAKELHEVIGLLFVVAGLAHVVFNWKSMKSYFSKKIFIFMSIAILAVSLSFIIPAVAEQDGSNPKKVMIESVLNSSLELSIKILNSDMNSAMNKLKENGIVIKDYNSIKEIAKANKISPFRIVKLITSSK